MASRQSGHVWGGCLQVWALGLDTGYFVIITSFIRRERGSVFWRKGIQDVLIRNKDYKFYPECNKSFDEF